MKESSFSSKSGRAVGRNNYLPITPTMRQERISAQQLSKQFHIGWPRAADIIEDFCSWHIVSAADAKLPRQVLPHRLEDVPEELLSRLERNSITRIEVQTTMDNGDMYTTGFEQ